MRSQIVVRPSASDRCCAVVVPTTWTEQREHAPPAVWHTRLAAPSSKVAAHIYSPRGENNVGHGPIRQTQKRKCATFPLALRPLLIANRKKEEKKIRYSCHFDPSASCSALKEDQASFDTLESLALLVETPPGRTPLRFPTAAVFFFFSQTCIFVHGRSKTVESRE